MEIRDATAADWPAIWPIFEAVVREGETYAYDTDLGYDEGRKLWMEQPPARVTVATGDDGAVLGTAKMGANRGGNGAHVATASFMVAADARGRGVGRALGEDVIAWATAQPEFRAIQFNAVVASNTAAVALWQALGFAIVGTVPEAFNSPKNGYVGLHVMFRRL